MIAQPNDQEPHEPFCRGVLGTGPTLKLERGPRMEPGPDAEFPLEGPIPSVFASSDQEPPHRAELAIGAGAELGALLRAIGRLHRADFYTVVVHPRGLPEALLGRPSSFRVLERSGEARIEGSPDKDLIHRVIQRRIPQLRRCYGDELKDKPGLAGTVVVRFAIAPSGDTQAVEVTDASTLKDPKLSECFLSTVGHWKFPSPRNGGTVLVAWPFVLQPAAGQ